MNIQSVYIRNFRSYGDDGVEINLKDLGPVLVTGPNGAGKSTIIESIVWCLFNKLPGRKRAPGDRVINWDSGKNCMVSISLDDGHVITRTRKFEGHSDLLITKDGSPIDGGDSTNANAQKTLESKLQIDYDTFISTTFFAQSSGCFLELTDSSQKGVIKRLFGLGKLQFYADVAKERLQESETAIEKLRNKSSQIQNDLDSAESKKSKAEQARDTFTSEKKAAIDKCENKITELMESKGQIVDIEEIEKSWETITIAKNKSEQLQHKIDNANQFIESTNEKINAVKSQKSELETEIHKIETSIRLKEEQWDAWEQKRDSVCPTCETPLTGQYIDDKVREKKAESAEEIAQLNASGAELHQQLKSVQDEISENEHKRDLISSKMDRIVAKKRQLDDSIKQTTNGKVTINEAKSHNNYVRNVEERIQDQRNLVRELESQKNPHDKTVKEIELQIHDLKSRKDDQESQLRSEEERASHIQFIYKAYSDKRNIRAFILSSHLPLLNSRLSYYMNEMDLGRDMQFDHLLNMKSDKWDYDDHSGGERKRIDLALMCALYDTAQSIHGRTSNLLVLDEIDKELDSQGVDDYVHLIMDDLANRIPTILVISHKEEICHAFPLQIKVNNDGESVLLNGT